MLWPISHNINAMCADRRLSIADRIRYKCWQALNMASGKTNQTL